jgi:acyl-CoA oxidase
MGKLSSYACVYAKLILNGKSHGVHAFMVPIRDPTTYAILPGCEMGDIGPKFGYNSKDNSFLIFKNVRIPRTNMLRRYTEVDREGSLNIHGDLRVLYSVMLLTRVQLASYAGVALG